MSDKIVIKEILDLALKSHTENKLENAKKNYKKILEIDPEHFETNYLLGTLYLQDKKFNEAKINFNKAIKIKI
jgi:Tfp pilus assembly protein PilF